MPRLSGRRVGRIDARVPRRRPLGLLPPLLGDPRQPRHAALPHDCRLRERQLVGVGLQMTLPGVPMLFAGDELGLEGEWGEDARRTMPWDRPAAPLLDEYRRLIALRRTTTRSRAAGSAMRTSTTTSSPTCARPRASVSSAWRRATSMHPCDCRSARWRAAPRHALRRRRRASKAAMRCFLQQALRSTSGG